MRKTTLALAFATTLGGLAFAAVPASAMPMTGTGIQADTGAVTQVRMTSSERMMMKKRMMREKMMHRRMMKKHMMHRM